MFREGNSAGVVSRETSDQLCLAAVRYRQGAPQGQVNAWHRVDSFANVVAKREAARQTTFTFEADKPTLLHVTFCPVVTRMAIYRTVIVDLLRLEDKPTIVQRAAGLYSSVCLLTEVAADALRADLDTARTLQQIRTDRTV